MNYLPYYSMTDTDASRNMLTQFLGYNHSLRTNDGEWYDMRNLTSKYYPVFSPRPPRGALFATEKLQGCAGKDKLAYVSDNRLYYGEKEILNLVADRYQRIVEKPDDWDINCSQYFIDQNGTHVQEGANWEPDIYYKNLFYDADRMIVSMGAYLVVFPDKKYINTVDESDYGDLEATFTNAIRFAGDLPRKVTLTPCDADGNSYELSAYRITTSVPADWNSNYASYYIYENGQYYLNNGSSPSSYKSDLWRPHVYYEQWERISSVKPDNPEDGDVWIDITNAGSPVTRKYSSTMQMWVEVSTVYFKIECLEVGSAFCVGDTIRICDAPDQSLNTDYNIVKIDSDCLVVTGVISSAVEFDDTITIKRECPDMDFVIEGENRLWGCRYGISSKTGKFVNEIYACKLGDFKNWYTYVGISTDSYAVSLGSDGAFTGAVFYAGYPTFFKERYIHRIAGSYPANYQMYTTMCDGVQAGSGKSLAIVNGCLIYKGVTDVMTYTGSYPASVSAAFSDERYYKAVAGEIGNKYYVSMHDKNGQYRLFVYDTARGLWHIEDETKAKGFARVSDLLYCMTDDGMFCITGDAEKAFDWYAQTGIQGFSYPDHTYVSRINIRASIADQSSIAVFIEYNSDGKWVPCGNLTGERFKSEILPIIPRRCDHYALRLEGHGDCKIYSITRTIEQGSDEQW